MMDALQYWAGVKRHRAGPRAITPAQGVRDHIPTPVFTLKSLKKTKVSIATANIDTR